MNGHPGRGPGIAVRELPLRLTLLYLLLFPGVLWTERWSRLLLGATGLLAPRLAARPAFWVGASVICALPLLDHWPRSDNHAYLILYWSVALAACLGLRDPARGLAQSARLLIGFTFAFATLWKAALSPDFVSGDFFRVSLLLDPRFADLSVLAGGLSPADYLANERVLDAWAGVAGSGEVLVEPLRLRTLGIGLTAFTLACEAAIALAFLAPARLRLARWRDAFLLLFLVTTFAFATVPGFGCLLAVLGAAQARGLRASLAYVGAFVLVLSYSIVPWSSLWVAWD